MVNSRPSFQMKVFSATKVPRRDPQRLKLARLAGEVTRQAGHQPFLAYQEILERGLSEARDFMPFVRQHIRQAGLVVLLYDLQLRGGLIEAGIAYADGVPLWLFYQAGCRVSSSALGCAERALSYTDLDDFAGQLSACFATM